MKQLNNTYGVYIGGASKETIEELHKLISSILEAPYVDQAVKIQALQTLQQLSTSPTNTNLSNISINMKDNI